MKVLSIFFLLIFYNKCFSQKTIIFIAQDGLPITADLYTDKSQYPYMILFHMANSSRGEFREIAPKMMKFEYNCLAVDLRSGNESNYVLNETHQAALDKNKKTDFLSSLTDIELAIDYAYNLSNKKPVVLVGSTFSASLCLICSLNNDKVKAVIAFSPGEYFESVKLKDKLKGFDKPALITGTKEESKYWDDIFFNVDPHYLTYFIPQNNQVKQGSMVLLKSNDSKIEYWIEIMMFLRKLL